MKLGMLQEASTANFSSGSAIGRIQRILGGYNKSKKGQTAARRQGIGQYYNQDSDTESASQAERSSLLSVDASRTSYHCVQVTSPKQQQPRAIETESLAQMQTSQGSGDGLSSLSTLEENSVTTSFDDTNNAPVWELRSIERKQRRQLGR
ncbi:hypothetical protein Ciccas_012772 [Cichlidogyrus casuarinus]|uniref:Uncharacterized protein n=1 Tax=Cichlidogyrus casuarinus TaxID=1844966 RepID=A0ABD2PMD5_9PLAT